MNICDGTCIIFDGETKISAGKQKKQGGESALNSNLAGRHIFLAGRGRYWGVFSTTWIAVPCRLVKRCKIYEKQPLINIIIFPLNCHAFSIQDTIKVLENILFSHNTLETTHTMLM